jgi:hypothetical protein
MFPSKLNPFNIDVCLKYRNTSYTLLKAVYIIIQVWKTWIKKKKRLFTTLYAFVWFLKIKKNYGFNF